MSIDHNMIKIATSHSIKRVKEATTTECPYILILENFLDNSLLEKLNQYIINTDDWVPQENYGPEVQILDNRKKINWREDSVVEEIHIVLENLTELLNKLFDRNNKFLGINLWKDTAGYSISPHVDNPNIDLAIQIYLNSSETDLGTKFEYDNKIIQSTYKKNFGYLMDNRGKVVHYFDSTIPVHYARYSLYGIWTNIQ